MLEPGTFELSLRVLGNEFIGIKIAVDNIKDGVVYFNTNGPAHVAGQEIADPEEQDNTVSDMAKKQDDKGIDKYYEAFAGLRGGTLRESFRDYLESLKENKNEI